MNRSRGTVGPPLGLTGSPLQRHAAKPNRLRRSCRETLQTQADSPQSRQPEFKTPTRIPRCRAGAGFSVESPNNDSDFQQDIIWDATSPSPNRLGKRGKKQKPPGVVDISEIVNRIAPKHGRPTVAEPTLQQWIGDSASIPCTPDVQVPKPKKKSPRPNRVDDLLKLAKQFDFNMFRRDEEEVDDRHRRSPELPSEDVVDLEDDQNNVSLPVIGQPAANRTEEQLHPDQHMEDDLDFLFDGPTQCLSGRLSQVSSAPPSQVEPPSKEASGKPPASSHGRTSDVSTTTTTTTTTTKVASVKDEFEDDWENDDLLNDSLLFETTQNPQTFAAPQYSSTQKPPSQTLQRPRGSPADVVVRSAVPNVEKVNVRQRMTFKLEPHKNFSLQRIQSNSKVDYSLKASVEDTQPNRFSSGNRVVVEAGSQRTWQRSNPVKSDPPKPQFHQRTSVSKHNATASNASATKTSDSFPTKPASVSSRGEAPAAAADPDLLDEDLSLFFSPDPVWDDPADDDLLCEMCEDVENQLQSAENVSAAENRQPANRQPFEPKKQTPTSLTRAPGRPPGRAAAGSSASDVAAGAPVTDSFRYSQTKSTSGSTKGSTWSQGSSRVPSAPRGNPSGDRFTFKKPSNPVSTVTSKVVGKCSAAEIEQKKQQALEKRRQRLQNAQNLRAPT